MWAGCLDRPVHGYVYCGIHMYGNRADHVHEWVQIGATRSCKFCDKPAPVPQRTAAEERARIVADLRHRGDDLQVEITFRDVRLDDGNPLLAAAARYEAGEHWKEDADED